MGTNFYWIEEQGETCEHCGRCEDQPIELHIGKSSFGWTFGLRIHPEEGISTFGDWVERWESRKGFIRNEYGDRISLEEMISWITERDHPDGLSGEPAGPDCTYTYKNYEFC